MCDTASETEGRDLTDETLRSAQKPGRLETLKYTGRGNLVGIRIEFMIILVRKP